MKRTISVMVGAGSVSHNERKFIADNVDPDRIPLNICFCNEKIKDVYHELFDEAVERYNAKQTRKDRKISNYYEKICASRQEKEFHEIVLQVGNREDSNVKSDVGKLTAQILGEYMESFQERNLYLRVFSAHLHMDESTPHIHIDYVPFITSSTRGLDTRVSLKKALEAQGFSGNAKRDTEWSRWVQSEKEELAKIMERHGIEWEQKGTHEKHLSVLDYKKKMRTQEIELCEEKIDDLQTTIKDVNLEVDQAKEQLQEYTARADNVISKVEGIDKDEKYTLPEPGPFFSMKKYLKEEVKPLINRFKDLIKGLLYRYNDLADQYNDLSKRCGQLYDKAETLARVNDKLWDENLSLKKIVGDFKKVKKVLGAEQIDIIVKSKNKNKENGRNM